MNRRIVREQDNLEEHRAQAYLRAVSAHFSRLFSLYEVRSKYGVPSRLLYIFISSISLTMPCPYISFHL